MRIVFLGTPEFAVPSLKRVLEDGYTVAAVVTQPDRPVGRKQVLTPSPVKAFAAEKKIPVFQYEKIRKEGVGDLRALAPDLMITCAFGQILSQEILDIPKFGVVNVHASLLPKYRGSAPIQWAVINGEKKTGITIMQTEAGIDTGSILLQKELEIGANETAGELSERLSLLGADAIGEALPVIAGGAAVWIEQDEERATHVKMLVKEDGKMDFTRSAEEVRNLVRGVNPWPGAYFEYDGETVKVWEVETVCAAGTPGEVLPAKRKGELLIACGDGAVSVLSIQPAGKRRMSAKEFSAGRPIPAGTILK